MIDEKKLIKYIEKEAHKYTMYCDEDKRHAILGITDSYIELIKSFPEKRKKEIKPKKIGFYCLLIGGLLFINAFIYDTATINDTEIVILIFLMVGVSLVFIAIVLGIFYGD